MFDGSFNPDDTDGFIRVSFKNNNTEILLTNILHMIVFRDGINVFGSIENRTLDVHVFFSRALDYTKSVIKMTVLIESSSFMAYIKYRVALNFCGF